MSEDRNHGRDAAALQGEWLLLIVITCGELRVVSFWVFFVVLKHIEVFIQIETAFTSQSRGAARCMLFQQVQTSGEVDKLCSILPIHLSASAVLLPLMRPELDVALVELWATVPHFFHLCTQWCNSLFREWLLGAKHCGWPQPM